MSAPAEQPWTIDGADGEPILGVTQHPAGEPAGVVSYGENSPRMVIGDRVYVIWEQTRASGGTDLMAAMTPRFENGYYHPSEGHGFGTEIDEELVRKHRSQE